LTELKNSRLAADAAHDFLNRSAALKHREQTAVEDRAHTIAHRGSFDRSVVGALENQIARVGTNSSAIARRALTWATKANRSAANFTHPLAARFLPVPRPMSRVPRRPEAWCGARARAYRGHDRDRGRTCRRLRQVHLLARVRPYVGRRGEANGVTFEIACPRRT
jgi:hypothetical protein